jgi:myo-inositol-1(or 4)-monophosphatase
VVLDPVDGSTSHTPYSLTLAPSVADPLRPRHEPGSGVRWERNRRGGGAELAVGHALVEGAVVAFSGMPQRRLPWKQLRSLGSAALELCDVASGALDAYLSSWLSPWDYLGGLLVCREVGAPVVDAHDGELVVTDPETRRQLIAAATPDLLAAVRPALPP